MRNPPFVPTCRFAPGGTTARRWADEKTRTDDNPGVQASAYQQVVLDVKKRIEWRERPGTAHVSVGRCEAQFCAGRLSVHAGSIVHSVVMTPATIRVVKGLENAAARAPPELLDENARDQLAVGA